MDNRDNGPTLCGIDILVAVPCGRGRTSFRLTVADDASNHEVWVIHDRTKGNREGVSELATFVDGAWCFGIDVGGESARGREAVNEVSQTLLVTSILGHKSREGIFKPEAR